MSDPNAALAAYERGRADGLAGDHIDPAARIDPQTGTDYGRGLQDGRTERVDAELRERGDQEQEE